MATAQLTQQATNISVVTLIRRFIPTIIEGSIPFATYMLVKGTLHTSDVVALSVGALIPAAIGTVRFIRNRHVDIMGMMILLGIVGSIVAVLIGGSPQILLIRESFVGALFGLAFLISMFMPRPLMFYMVRHFRAGNNAVRLAVFNASWQQPATQRKFRTLTLVWGLGTIGEFALRVAMVYTLSIPVVLTLSSIVFPAIYALMGLWSMWYLRRK